MRKATAIATCALFALMLTAGSAFAGKYHGTAFTGNSYGNDNKRVGTCPANYTLTQYDAFDLNGDGYVCMTINAGGNNYIDNMAR